jgi:hypothetical protein
VVKFATCFGLDMRISSGRSLSKNRSRGFTYKVKYYIKKFLAYYEIPCSFTELIKIHIFRTCVLWSLVGMVNLMSCSICLWRLCGGKVPWRLVFEPWLEYYWGPGSVFFWLRQVLCVCVCVCVSSGCDGRPVCGCVRG